MPVGPRLRFTVGSLLAFNEQPVLTDTLFVPLSRFFIVLINTCIERWADVFYVNIRYVYVHASMSDYLLSTRFFFLPPLNEETVTLLLKTHNF